MCAASSAVCSSPQIDNIIEISAIGEISEIGEIALEDGFVLKTGDSIAYLDDSIYEGGDETRLTLSVGSLSVRICKRWNRVRQYNCAFSATSHRCVTGNRTGKSRVPRHWIRTGNLPAPRIPEI